ncbi:T9SS type A sorting domain-containing protein [Chryseobacterium caseinilyticum]|uniref:T9SS type A sorting domain-containing protein n=1 Tax=Chryseobacterium caseinilyticum TaxID=2771428 RepID=A0ABR8ZFS3_9FLAO|nr:T9SS type A sorting domain-containing protein [Chryseobacterium caseinilyticum]MBD8083710.1 T9SS type A sorting domain-containing protein [Chryseobacterium caseinilyticum]
MKNIFIIAFILMTGFSVKAQQPALTGNTWNLEKVILNNVDHFFPSSVSTIYATATFSVNSLHSVICNSMSATVTYNNNQINFIGSGLTLGSCPNFNNNEYNVFEGYYFGQFFGSNTSNGFYPTNTYLIENINNQLKLTLTNPNGDKAIFWAGNLAVHDSEYNIINVYPNPVKDKLLINAKSSFLKITLYNLSGSMILDKKIIKDKVNFELDMTDLVSGIYFLNVKDDQENYIYDSKIIKK